MPILTPPTFDKKAQHADDLWVRKECYRFYIQQRRLHCTFMERMDLWLLAPFCSNCIQSDPFEPQRQPDIIPPTWEEDVLLAVGKNTLDQTQLQLLKNPEYGIACKKCGRRLRPWNGDEVHVVSYHLEEHYGIDLETPGKAWPSKELRNRIFALYDFKCFACNSEEDLHIDHIQPRALGGDAAFRNLQPLCKECGKRKADTPATEVAVHSAMYFSSPPCDGLFW